MAEDTYVDFVTSLGSFVVELYNQAAPLTVANFLSYVENPTAGDNYDGSFFHRLVPGFVLQGGGFDVQNGSFATIPTSAPVANEFSASDPNVLGTIAMAKLGSDPNSATDQFFFNLGDNTSNLDNQNGGFTVFGRVVENYSVVSSIAALPVYTGLQSPFDQLPVTGTVASTGPTPANLVTFNVAVTQSPISGTQAAQTALDDATVTPFSTVALADPANPSGAGDDVAITVEDASGSASSALGTVSIAAGGLALSQTGPGSYVLGGASSIGALQTALDQLVFTPAPLGSQAAPVTVTFDLQLQFQGGSQGSVDDQSTSLVVSHDPASDLPTSDTITGADGLPRMLSFGSGTLAARAAPLLAGVAPASTLFIDSAGGAAMSASQTAAIDDAFGPVTVVGNAAANETIAAGAGAFSFIAGSGSGSVVAGGGADLVYLPAGGDWLAALGNGVDTVVAASGDDTIATGKGGSFVFLGSGSSSVASTGADTILGGTGSATVSATGANGVELFSLGAPLDFIAGTGASTVVSGNVAATLFGGTSGGTLMFGDGETQYVGSGATDTVVGLNGSLTAQGGAGGGLFFGGTAGDNVVTAGSGNVTAVGGGAGDVLTATGSASDLFAGGTGAETLTGAGSTGANTFFAGFGPETLIGGGGSTALVAGAGDDLLTAGSGVTLFLFAAGSTASGSDTIAGFNPSQDFVKLAGYASSGANVVANATVVNGSSVISLADGTQITFAGIAQLNASSFT